MKYHEHDTLLQNRPEEDLSEEERKTAWEEYEKEKERELISNDPILARDFAASQSPTPPPILNTVAPRFKNIAPAPPTHLTKPVSYTTNFVPKIGKSVALSLAQSPRINSRLPRVFIEILQHVNKFFLSSSFLIKLLFSQNSGISFADFLSRLTEFLGIQKKVPKVSKAK